MERRLLVIHFDHVIPMARRIPNLGQMIAEEELDALLHYAVRGATRLVRRRRYSIPSSSAEMITRWKCETDPVLAFLLDDTVVRLKPGRRVRVAQAYASFRYWAERNGVRGLPPKNGFARRAYSAGLGITSERRARERFMAGLELLPPVPAV